MDKVTAGSQALSRCEMFSRLTEQQLEAISELCRSHTFEKDSFIFREGQPARNLYVVEQGRVALEMTVRNYDGGRSRPATVALIGSGEAFGWSSIVEPHVLTLTAKAAESCNLVSIEGSMLRKVLDQDRDSGYLVMAGLSELLASRLRSTRENLIYERGWTMLA